MRCEACGLDIPANSNFCSHCGATLNAQGKMQQMATTQTPASGTVAANYVTAPMARSAGNDQENVLWEDNPSMRTALPRLVAIAIIYVIALIIEQLAMPEKEPKGMVMWLTTGLFALVFIGMLIRDLISRWSISYRLSTQRLFVTTGIFNKRTDELELEQYKDIFVTQSLLDKMVGCGDIRLVTTDETNGVIEMKDLMNPVEKKEAIRAAARDRKQALGIVRREEL